MDAKCADRLLLVLDIGKLLALSRCDMLRCASDGEWLATANGIAAWGSTREAALVRLYLHDLLSTAESVALPSRCCDNSEERVKFRNKRSS